MLDPLFLAVGVISNEAVGPYSTVYAATENR